MERKFEEVYAMNVNEKTEKKNGLTYLSWAWAWAEFKKIYPNANYEIKKFGERNLPYVYDEEIGYMVFTSVTVDELTYEMWLPVMDSANKTMKAKPYEYKTKYGQKTVEAATMFDVNKTIMRCLVKNLAMFGLGLYIYAGEDLPEDISDLSENEFKVTEVEKTTNDTPKEEKFKYVEPGENETISKAKSEALKKAITNNNISDLVVASVLGTYDYEKIEDIKNKDYALIVNDLRGSK